ncbi:MAG TPA: hypothetical protein VFE46_01490 [Pirellulales bacterium]|jgi:hypothetical protein|nr:hypothetical protein [Pirellulales bacterium]
MNTHFKNGLMVAVVTGLSITAIGSAMAQSYMDGSSKMRGDYGQMSRSQLRPTYQAAAPAQQRSFSYEPTPVTAQPTQPGSAQGSVAQRSTQTYRAYSYEPNAGTSSGTMRSRSGSTPLWALPKSDSRKFGGQ